MLPQKFYNDLHKAKKAENIVSTLLVDILPNFKVENVADEKEYFHKGDISLTSKKTNQQFFIDVKDDSNCYKTGNFVAEDELYYKSTNGAICDGYMRTAGYDYVAIMSKSEHKFYVLDFHKWQKCYTKIGRRIFYKCYDKGEYISASWSYLNNINELKRLGVVKQEIFFEEKDNNFSVVNQKIYS